MYALVIGKYCMGRIVLSNFSLNVSRVFSDIFPIHPNDLRTSISQLGNMTVVKISHGRSLQQESMMFLVYVSIYLEYFNNDKKLCLYNIYYESDKHEYEQ